MPPHSDAKRSDELYTVVGICERKKTLNREKLDRNRWDDLAGIQLNITYQCLAAESKNDLDFSLSCKHFRKI